MWPTTVHHLVCERSGLGHSLTIDLPARHDRLDRLPVILVLDGQWIGGTVTDATRIMSMGGEAPEAVVASLSFAATTMSELVARRACWFTPTGWVPPKEVGVTGLTAADTGRAGEYLKFIRDQVFAVLDSDDRFAPRWLVGHSFSALFGLSVLFDTPTLFDKYLLASPSVWWHDRSILAREQMWADANDDLEADVFLSAGAAESAGQFDEERFAMAANMVALRDAIGGRGYRGLRMESAILDDVSHNSTIGPAIARGLAALHRLGRRDEPVAPVD